MIKIAYIDPAMPDNTQIISIDIISKFIALMLVNISKDLL